MHQRDILLRKFHTRYRYPHQSVNILSGNLKPNLGRYDNPPEWDEILKYYSGTELKQHFEKIKNKEIRASIKPQQVHHIAQAFDGTGKELLDKYDERGVSRDLIKELGLQNSMESVARL